MGCCGGQRYFKGSFSLPKDLYEKEKIEKVIENVTSLVGDWTHDLLICNHSGGGAVKPELSGFYFPSCRFTSFK